ncbi:hypothetical protein [endosymbiont of Riftia pachyptila]|nr:hypothetical protein [endosymbiont of Riftia pachyptila]
MDQPKPQAYCLRRLNPFNGTLQVFESDHARAFSADGRRWEIQVLSHQPQGLWANTPLGDKAFFRFGIWSAAKGLKQVPINPLFDIQQMIDAAAQLIEPLQLALLHLPFPPGDPYELWSLDENSAQPIALLASVVTDASRQSIEASRWVAAQQGDFSFISPTLSGKQVPNNDSHNPRVHASILEAMVRGRAGPNHRRGWFLRQPGEPVLACDAGQSSPSADAFPPLPLSDAWEHPDDCALFEEYLDWKAPRLLQLPQIPDAWRAELEQRAVKSAIEVERCWRLYPKILDKQLLNRARVEAKIRTSAVNE